MTCKRSCHASSFSFALAPPMLCSIQASDRITIVKTSFSRWQFHVSTYWKKWHQKREALPYFMKSTFITTSWNHPFKKTLSNQVNSSEKNPHLSHFLQAFPIPGAQWMNSSRLQKIMGILDSTVDHPARKINGWNPKMMVWFRWCSRFHGENVCILSFHADYSSRVYPSGIRFNRPFFAF